MVTFWTYAGESGTTLRGSWVSSKLQNQGLVRTTSYLHMDIRSAVAWFVERLSGVREVASPRLSPESQCCVLGHDTLYAD